jgi:hypothetical protein
MQQLFSEGTNMRPIIIPRILASVAFCLLLSACQTTSVVKSWQSSQEVSPPDKLAVIVMAAESR